MFCGIILRCRCFVIVFNVSLVFVSMLIIVAVRLFCLSVVRWCSGLARLVSDVCVCVCVCVDIALCRLVYMCFWLSLCRHYLFFRLTYHSLGKQFLALNISNNYISNLKITRHCFFDIEHNIAKKQNEEQAPCRASSTSWEGSMVPQHGKASAIIASTG